MKTSKRKKHEERPNTTIIELLRRQFQVQSAIPAKHQHCVVKLERIDIGEPQASAENGPNQPYGCIIHVRRRSECEDLDEPVREAIKKEYEEISNESRPATPSTSNSGGVVVKQEIKVEIERMDQMLNRTTRGHGTIHDSTEPIIIDDSDDMDGDDGRANDINLSINNETDKTPKEAVTAKLSRKKKEIKSMANKGKRKNASRGNVKDTDPKLQISRDNQVKTKVQPNKKIDAGQLSFRCSICCLRFKGKDIADLHEMNCNKVRLECHICKYTRKRLVSVRYLTQHPKLVVRFLTQHMRTHTGYKEFRCDECRTEFALQRTYDVHMAMHANKPIFKCNSCGREFVDSHLWKYHEKLCMKRKRFECYVCKKNTRFSFSDLKRHFQHHHLERRKFTCVFCPKTFVTGMGHKQHTMSMHGDPDKLKCKHCNQQFLHAGPLSYHENNCIQQRARQGKKLIKCSHCPKEFLFERSLRGHESKCAKRIRFQCYLCGKAGIRSQIKLHMRSHTGERPEQCSFCPRNFREKSKLTRHMKRSHQEHIVQPHPSQMFRCPQCDRQFTTRNLLTVHSQKFCKIFECHLCGHGGYSYHGSTPFTRQFLSIHMKAKHTGVKDFQCPECPLAFVTKCKLKRHAERHSKKFPFECFTCNFKYADDYKLLSHRCSKSRQFECYLCKRPANGVRGLKTHMQCHYITIKCVRCSKVFSTKTQYQFHIRWHKRKDLMTVECDKCGQKCATSAKMRFHKKRCMNKNL